MSMNTTSEAIRAMEATMNQTITNIQGINQSIRDCAKNNAEWNDEQGQAFGNIMQEIANSTNQPINTLVAATQALEQLAKAVDKYNNIKF